MRTPRAWSVWWLGLVAGIAAVLMAPKASAQPVAADDFYTTNQATPLNVADASGVLVNDTAGGGTLQAVLVTNVANGILLFGGTGGFFYLPNLAFTGNDSFTYQARGPAGESNVATVTISVLPTGGGNVPPVARADAYTTGEDQVLNVAAPTGVLANDLDANSDPLTAVLVSGVSTGTLALQPDGSFGYTPPPEFSGTVSFTYQADDGAARSSTTTVTIAVNAVNDAPAAQADSFTTAEDTTLSVTGNGVLGNDTDAEGDALTAHLVRNVTNGTLQLNANGSFTYSPPANFAGTTTFTYSAHDASGQSAAATVTITVTAVNDPPFISNAPPTTATEGVTYRYTLAASDPDGTTPTITAPTIPSWLTFTPPATVSGTPGDADVGTHAATMQVSDGVAPAVTSSWQIAVEGVDNPPAIAPIPEQTATETTPFDLDLARFVTDSDTEAGSLTFAATAGLPPGVTLSAAGRLAGTPQTGSSVGTHAVRFTVADEENTVPGQLRLVVLPAGRVDLAVTMSASPNPVTLETPATWTLTVANRAPQVEAPGATLEATFAGEVPFLFDVPPPSSGCTLAAAGEHSTLTCTLGRLAGSAQTSIALTGRGSFAGDVFAQARVAVVGAGTLDETPGNDTTTASLSLAQRIAGTPAQRIPLPDARAVAAGDFNGDGFDDLVVATASAQGVLLFTNVADPTNPGRRTFATPAQALGGEALTTDVIVADLDRDGDLDVVTAAGGGAPERVFLNAGGVFASAALGPVGSDSRAVAVGDINGDASVDLVFARPETSAVFMNTGSGGAFTPRAGVGPHDARDALLVDLFGDTLPELVLATAGDGAAVYRNTGGVLTLAVTLPTGPTSAVATGDFNADGRADLAFARDTATLPAVPSALVWLNGGGANGQFFVSDELGAAAATALVVRDFNLDQRADVLALNGYGARIFTNAGGASATFALHAQQLATPGARAAAAGRFSNDDRVDLAVVGDGVAVFVNDGAGNFGEPDSTPPVIALRGSASVTLTIDSQYVDAGATATDAEDGDLTSRIVVTNPVDTTVLGTYTITYSVSDLSGNAATPVTRTVNVQGQPVEGGGGALYLELAALLIAALGKWRRRRAA
jgi:VCBS repeat-containing protein